MSSPSPEVSPSPTAPPDDAPDYALLAGENKARAVEYAKLIKQKYWVSATQSSFLIPGQGTPFLWPYTEQVSMANAVLELLDPETEQEDYTLMKTYLEELLEGLRYYRVQKTAGYDIADYGTLNATGTSYAIYNSGRNGSSKDSVSLNKDGIYFDDNIWVAKEFYNAYRNLGDIKYLNEALNVVNWIIGEGYETGRSSQPFNGTSNIAMNGIYWKWGAKDKFPNKTDDNINASLNTCSSAPTAMMLVKLYNAMDGVTFTGVTSDSIESLRSKYLLTAKQIYNFVYNVLRDENSNTFKDKVFLFQDDNGNKYLGKVDEQILPYNTGCMLTAGAELYHNAVAENKPANAKSYLERTKEIAAGADVKFSNVNVVEGQYAYNKNSWFSSFLIEGYQDAYAFDEAAETYIEHMRSSLDYGWKNNRDKDGLVCPAWVAGWSEFTNDGVSEENARQILLQSANAHCYAMLASYYAGLAK